MNPIVWHSRMMKDYRIGNKNGVAVKWFGREWEPPVHAPPPRSMDTIHELFRYMDGEPQAREVFPEALQVFDQTCFRMIGDLSAAGGFYIVQRKLAEILLRSDLGRGRLIPVPVYEQNRVTPIGRAFYVWEFGSRASALLPEQSSRIRPDGHAAIRIENRWKVDSDVEDGDIALSAAAVSGAPDVWCDPRLRGSLFLSDEFVTALRRVDVETDLHLRRFRIL